MLKIFLVEDERIIREGIQKNIDWEAHGYDFCGQAADGELAFPLILEQKPDMVITDIKMPFVDGIELSRLIAKELPKTKIILLSGHDKFEYAREAIRLGVVEYILKPVNRVELMKAIDRVAEQIYLEQKAAANPMGEEGSPSKSYEVKQLFNKILKGKMTTAAILKEGKRLGMNLSATCYEIMLFRYGSNSELSQKVPLEVVEKRLGNLVEAYNHVWWFEQGALGDGLLLTGDSHEALSHLEGRIISDLEGLFDTCQVTYHGGLGSVVNRLSRLFASYEVAEKGLNHAILHRLSEFISGQVRLEEATSGDNESLQNLDLSSIDFSQTQAFLRHGERTEIKSFVKSFLEDISEASEKSLLFKQYLLMNVYITVTNFVKSLGVEEAFLGHPLMSQLQVNDLVVNFGQTAGWLEQVLDIAMAFRDQQRFGKFNKIIEKAKVYIDSHYTEDTLSLGQVADYVGLSPSHFSNLFSHEMGRSFIRYLIDVRMKEAKRLLKCSDLKCGLVGASVGYKDPHYFSSLFKKETGSSPMKYREQG